MSARIAGVGDQPLDRPALNLICWPRFLARARARPRLAGNCVMIGYPLWPPNSSNAGSM
jgi:hypothetical protein